MHPRAAELFDAVAELPVAGRDAWLDAACADDPELRRDVERLLRADAKACAFLATPPPLPNSRTSATRSGKRVSPTLFGPFRVVRRLGEGGMGEVWLAERHDGEFEQQVAIKQVAFPSGAMLQRFRRERRILARLEHPNIAHLIDGGVDGDGLPWLAMEYVEGVPITDYARHHSLDMHARMAMFLKVCDAVQYAHRNLVVHRDLKPSNILVTTDGVPKLLDFGIAHVLDASDEQSTSTHVFTPAYAAPEQLRGERATTATDLYALGLILYELACGRSLPVDARTMRDNEWSAYELVRLATPANAAAAAAAAHPNDPKTTATLLRGDLGRIIAHALDPWPERRYASASTLGDDVQRWTEFRPIGIGRQSPFYLMRRFVRRHRFATAVASAALCLLVAISVVAIWQAARARQMAARADQARSFLADLLASTNPFTAQPNSRKTVDLLRDSARRIDREFGDAPDVQANLRATVADVLLRIGEPKAAVALLQHSVEQLRELHGNQSPAVGDVLARLALAQEESGDLDAAQADFTAAYAMLRDSGPTYAAARISAVTGLAHLANRRGNHVDAERMHEAVLEERQASEGPESPDVAMDLMNLAADSLYAERYARAESLALRAHAMLERTLGPRHPRMIYVDNVLGLAQVKNGHYVEGIATLRSALELARGTLQPGAMMIATVTSALGSMQNFSGDHDGAIATLSKARELNNAAHNPQGGITTMELGLAQLHADAAAALATLREARAALAKQTTDADFVTLCDAAYGAALAATGEPTEGERIARDARAELLASPRAQSARLGEIDDLLAGVLERKHTAAEARSLREEALATFRRVYGAAHPHTLAMAARIGEADAATPGNENPQRKLTH